MANIKLSDVIDRLRGITADAAAPADLRELCGTAADALENQQVAISRSDSMVGSRGVLAMIYKQALDRIAAGDYANPDLEAFVKSVIVTTDDKVNGLSSAMSKLSTAIAKHIDGGPPGPVIEAAEQFIGELYARRVT